MPEQSSVMPFNEIASQVTQPDSENDPHAEAEALEPLIKPLRTRALQYLERNNSPEWLTYAMSRSNYLDQIVSLMNHIEGGQDFILRELQSMKPDLTWYRGGTLTRWREGVGSANYQFYTPEQLDTYVIDGGGNGALGRPRLALSYLQKSHRPNPVLYSASIGSLIEGNARKGISLVSEHDYDLRIALGDNRPEYLTFCKNNLHIQLVELEEKQG